MDGYWGKLPLLLFFHIRIEQRTEPRHISVNFFPNFFFFLLQRTEVFVDVLNMPVTKKTVRGISEQRENESRRLWKEVTAGLKLNDIEKATNAKTSLEQKQRDEAKKRKEMNLEWETKVSILDFSPFLYFAYFYL